MLSRKSFFRNGIVLCMLLVAPTIWGESASIADLNKIFVMVRVNGVSITNYDLDQRVRLFVATGNSQIQKPYDDQKLIHRILEDLINDIIKSHEAARYSVTVSEQLMQQQLYQRIRQNNMTWEQMEQFLQYHQIQISTLEDQIRANLLWIRLVGSRFGMLGNISNQSVERAIKGEQRTQQDERVLLREILLSQENPKSLTYENLLEQIQKTKDKNTFADLAKEYSQSPTSSIGGYLGWVNLLALTKRAVESIRKTSPKSVTKPIVLDKGDVVLYWVEEKVASTAQNLLTQEVHLLFITFSGETAFFEATEFKKHTKDCADLSLRALEKGAQTQDLGNISLASLNKTLAEDILSEGAPYVFPPTPQDQGYRLVVACSIRRVTVQDATKRQKIEANLAHQEMLLASQRYLENLRREAVIEYLSVP